MLAGFVVWVALLVWHAMASRLGGSWPWLGTGLCLAAGGLIVFSGFR
jgi:hypothetical protein